MDTTFKLNLVLPTKQKRWWQKKVCKDEACKNMKDEAGRKKVGDDTYTPKVYKLSY